MADFTAAGRGPTLVLLHGFPLDRRADFLASVEQSGARGLPAAMDVRDPASVEAGGRQGEEAFGRLDVVANNAAAFGDAPVVDLDPAVSLDTIASNPTGPFLATRAAPPGMIRRRPGSLGHGPALRGTAVRRPDHPGEPERSGERRTPKAVRGTGA